jgi:glyoxylase-like metal-dependent hydrolase (beta-lactamase superfamily II)
MAVPVVAETPGLEYPWPTPPAAGEARVVAPGVRWLRMPLPFKLDHINLWLLEDDGGWAVIDTGIGLAPTREAWETVFAAHLDGRPVTRVVVTHFHPDHMGNAGWLAERWSVDLWCAQAEWFAAQLAWRDHDGDHTERRLAHYREHGLDAESLDRLRRRGNHYPGVVPTLASHYRSLREGDVVTLAGRRWDVLTVYGHSPEHVCLSWADGRVLVAGDQVLPKITTNVSVWVDQPLGNPLRQYLDSLPRFAPLAPDTLVLPSHGLPFRGLHARLDRLRLHHADRLARILDTLAEPRPAAELLPLLFFRELDTHQLGFAMGEVLAHLNLLESEGRVVRISGGDGITRFRRS